MAEQNADTSTNVDAAAVEDQTQQTQHPTEPQATPAATPAPEPAATVEPAAEPPKDNWAELRTKFAKGDEKLEKRLARYSSVESALEAMLAAQDKIAKGGHKTPLGDNPTPEELAAYREANGIPEAADKYEIALDAGLVVGEQEKPIVDGFLNVAHELNMKPAEVNKTLNWYFAEQEKQIAARQEQDEAVRVETDTQLAEVWGTEHKLNKNLIVGMLDQAPEGVKDGLMNARMPDGTPVMSHANTLRWLADTARTLNPVATVVPGSGTNAMQTIETELANLTKMMADSKSDYWKGPHAEANQKRYLDLVTAKQKYEG